MDTKHPLAEWRSAQGLTQAEVGDRIGKKRSFISMLEAGERFARVGTARKLASLTGLSFEVFLPPADPDLQPEPALNG